MKRPRKSKKWVCKKQWMKESWEREEEEDDEIEFPKRMTHYCSDHQILLVGDGDFSFSLSLAKAFASASNIVATSLDTYDEVIRKYKNAKSNLEELQKLGAYLLDGVDATKMKFHPDLNMRKFDRIIFNFPHAGFYGKEDNSMMIQMHRNLVFGFFKNASHMLREKGEVHINHKTTPPFDTWKIEELAEQSFLMMIECADFKQEDYPGYNNKRGHRSRCDDPFPLGKCSTFKFIYNPRSMKDHLRRNHVEVSREQEIQNMERFPASVDLNYHPRTRLPFEVIHNMEQIPAPIDRNYHPQTVLVQKLNQLDYYPQTSIFPKTDQLDHYSQTVLVQKLNQLDYYPQTSIFPKTDQLDHYSQTNLFPKTDQLDHYSQTNLFPKTDQLDHYSQTNLFPKTDQLDHYSQTNLFPKTDQLDHYSQTNLFPKTDQLDHFSQTNLFPKRNETMRSEFDLRNGYHTITNVTKIHGRVASSADYSHYARDMTHNTQRLLQPPMESSYNQSLQQWPIPTNFSLGLTEHHRRTMDVAPSMPLGARNDGFERSLRYLQEELNRNAQRSSDWHELERYNAEVSRRNLCYAMSK